MPTERGDSGAGGTETTLVRTRIIGLAVWASVLAIVLFGVPGMLGALLSTQSGVVIGSRYVPGGELDEAWPLYRRALSGWANLYVHTLLRVRIRDLTAGFKIWSAQALRDIGLERVQSNGYSFQVEMHYLATKLGHTILEVPIRFEERREGASKMSTSTKIESALMPFKLRSRHRDITDH